MHAGGVLRDAVLSNQSVGRTRAVFAPKVGALARLELACAAAPVQQVTAFSSVASLLGSGGQANYVAANAVLDAWAQARQAGGAPGVSVQWGAWGGGGMAAESGVEARMERMGVGVLSPDQGMCALEAMLSARRSPAGRQRCTGGAGDSQPVCVGALPSRRRVLQFSGCRMVLMQCITLQRRRLHSMFRNLSKSGITHTQSLQLLSSQMLLVLALLGAFLDVTLVVLRR
jgi:hypothetical protein